MVRVLAAACLALTFVAVPSARAEPDPARIAAAKAAADEILRRAEGSATSGQMPRRADPAVAKLLDAVFDLSILGRQAVPMARIAPVGELATNANRIGLAYILAGSGKTEVSAGDREALLRVDRNTVTFAPEVGQYTDFQLGVTEAMAKSALDFMASASPEIAARPNVQAGLGQMRGGLGQTIGGVLKTFAIAGLDDGWKLERLAALERVEGTASRFLGKAEKDMLGQLAGQVAAIVSPPLRERVQAFGGRISAVP